MDQRESSTGLLTMAAIVGIMAVLLLLACAGGGLWLLMRVAPRAAPSATPQSAYVVPASVTSGPYDLPLSSGDVVVRITLVDRGKVPYTSPAGDGESNDEHLLIRLSLENTSQSSTVDFLAWNQPNDPPQAHPAQAGATGYRAAKWAGLDSRDQARWLRHAGLPRRRQCAARNAQQA